MTNFIKKFLAFDLVCVMSIQFVSAQATAPKVQEGDSEEAADEIISVDLLFYRKNFINSYLIPSLVTGDSKSKNVSKKTDNVFWIKSDGKWKSFEVSSNAASQKVAYKGSPSFKIYQRVGGDDKAPELRPVSNIVVPKGASEVAILMFVKKTSVKFYPIDLSPQAIPKGKVVVMNMTSVPVALQIGNENKLMKSMSHLAFSSKTDGTAVPIKAAIREPKTKKWLVLYKSRISPTDDMRNLVLLYDPFERKSTNINVQLLNF